MKTPEDYIKNYVSKHNLLPIGSRVIITYPKSLYFYKTGTIIQQFFHGEVFVFDYLIRLDDGKEVPFDHPLITLISKD